VELDTPQNLYLRPKDPFTARFIGQVDLIRCQVVAQHGDQVDVLTPFGAQLRATGLASLKQGDEVDLLIRPEHVDMQLGHNLPVSEAARNVLEGTIVGTQFSGKLQECVVAVAGSTMRVQSLSRVMFAPEDQVTPRLPVERCIAVAADAGVVEPVSDLPESTMAVSTQRVR
jgi:ABC-type Fe3+/spermidine/putrescine transport system ATPase subunit